jgi:hypothetical protein
VIEGYYTEVQGSNNEITAEVADVNNAAVLNNPIGVQLVHYDYTGAGGNGGGIGAQSLGLSTYLYSSSTVNTLKATGVAHFIGPQSDGGSAPYSYYSCVAGQYVAQSSGLNNSNLSNQFDVVPGNIPYNDYYNQVLLTLNTSNNIVNGSTLSPVASGKGALVIAFEDGDGNLGSYYSGTATIQLIPQDPAVTTTTLATLSGTTTVQVVNGVAVFDNVKIGGQVTNPVASTQSYQLVVSFTGQGQPDENLGWNPIFTITVQ